MNECYYCEKAADGPMLAMGEDMAHTECVIRKLNELLDPNFFGEPSQKAAELVGFTGRMVPREEYDAVRDQIVMSGARILDLEQELVDARASIEKLGGPPSDDGAPGKLWEAEALAVHYKEEWESVQEELKDAIAELELVAEDASDWVKVERFEGLQSVLEAERLQHTETLKELEEARAKLSNLGEEGSGYVRRSNWDNMIAQYDQVTLNGHQCQEDLLDARAELEVLRRKE